jgi:hypothetical protein
MPGTAGGGGTGAADKGVDRMTQQAVKGRKQHTCHWCRNVIRKGDKYTRITVFPGEEPFISDVPAQVKYCSGCMPLPAYMGAAAADDARTMGGGDPAGAGYHTRDRPF